MAQPVTWHHGGSLTPDHCGVVYLSDEASVAAYYAAGRGEASVASAEPLVRRLALRPGAEIADLREAGPGWYDRALARLERACGLTGEQLLDGAAAEGARARCSEASTLSWIGHHEPGRRRRHLAQCLGSIWWALRLPEVWVGLRAAGVHGVLLSEPWYEEIGRWYYGDCPIYDRTTTLSVPPVHLVDAPPAPEPEPPVPCAVCGATATPSGVLLTYRCRRCGLWHPTAPRSTQ